MRLIEGKAGEAGEASKHIHDVLCKPGEPTS